MNKTPEWHAERAKGIGGSDANIIMKGEWQKLWEVKTGRSEPENLDGILAVQMGTYTEPFNVEWYSRQTGIAVSQANTDHLVHPEHTFMRANLDGKIPGGILECKHVSAYAKPEEIQQRYYPQLQHCMVVTDTSLAHLSVFYGNNKWEFYVIQRDPEYIEDLIKREKEFWSYVKTDTEPPNTDPVVVNFSQDEMREVDMTGNNAWASLTADWLENKLANKKFTTAASELKKLVEADVKKASGHGLSINRSKNGALTIREDK